MTDLNRIFNVNISGSEELVTPAQIKAELPLSEKSLATVLQGRSVLRDILDGKDNRIFMVVGPCSIHDPKAALEYADKLRALAKQVESKIVLVMRVYFEKPRTTVGWKGLINDPDMDDSFQIAKGLRIARKLLCDITELGLPTGTEALDPITPQYLSELVCWSAIGARTTESQTHREMASGLSMPVGFKNATDGSLQVAIDAMMSSANPHHFLGINQDGKSAKFSTKGNPYAHVVLRGGGGKTNYDAASIAVCTELLAKHHLRQKVVVDCSHANSNKDHERQPLVLADGIQQIQDGNKALCGFMIESHLHAGNQIITQDPSQMKYGVSVTDKCVDWHTTAAMIQSAYDAL